MKLSPHFLLSFTSVLKLLQSYSYSLFTLHTASVQIEYGKRHQVLGNASEKLSLGCQWLNEQHHEGTEFTLSK